MLVRPKMSGSLASARPKVSEVTPRDRIAVECLCPREKKILPVAGVALRSRPSVIAARRVVTKGPREGTDVATGGVSVQVSAAARQAAPGHAP